MCSLSACHAMQPLCHRLLGWCVARVGLWSMPFSCSVPVRRLWSLPGTARAPVTSCGKYGTAIGSCGASVTSCLTSGAAIGCWSRSLPAMQVRFKYGSRRPVDSDSDESDSDVDSMEDADDSGKDFKVLKSKVKSLRIDAILTFALGLSRNKVDAAFYSSSIYMNGSKLKKKGLTVTVDDEIDLVREVNQLNPDLLEVSRVEVLDINHSASNQITVKLKRFKRLTVENYEDRWGTSGASE